MRDSEQIGQLIAGVIVVLFAWGVLHWIWSGFARLFKRAPEAVPPSDLADAQRLLETPRPVLGTNEWVKTECRTVVCEAPIIRGEIEVHDRYAPGHDRKTCSICQEKPNYSGASYRPTN